ncbi:MAG: hypothetical protein IJY22_07455, partial [Clostridia bacterium]|nr:hypothetical protein [Clostridia bacterium]
MSIGIIFSVLFIALGGAALLFTIFSFGKKRRKHATVGAVLVLVAALLFLFVPFSFHTVEAGEIAVVKHLGEAKNVRTAGTYFDFWVTESYVVYDAKVQNME